MRLAGSVARRQTAGEPPSSAGKGGAAQAAEAKLPIVVVAFQYHATRVFSSVHYAAGIVEVPFRANRKHRQ